MLKIVLIMAIYVTLITFPFPLFFLYKIISEKGKQAKKRWRDRLTIYALFWLLFTAVCSIYVYLRNPCGGDCGFDSYCNEAGQCVPSK